VGECQSRSAAVRRRRGHGHARHTITANALTFNTTGYTITSNTLTLAGATPTITAGGGIAATISSVIAGTAGPDRDRRLAT
jgi:hypothetical protein